MRYKNEPNAEVAGVNPDDGSVIGPFKFDSKGVLEVPDDYQEANKLLQDAGLTPEQPKAKEPD